MCEICVSIVIHRMLNKQSDKMCAHHKQTEVLFKKHNKNEREKREKFCY